MVAQVRARLAWLGMGLAIGALIIAAGALLPYGSPVALLLFDYRDGAMPPFPFTIACFEWLTFGIGIGEIARHSRRARLEQQQLDRALLPEDETVMLDARSLLPFTRTIKASATGPFRLQRLLLRSIWQFQSSNSVSQAAGIMDSTLELFQHELDLQYNLSRYIAWLLPTIGFIGTVLGLGRGLAGIAAGNLDPAKTEQFQKVLQHTVYDLSIAFNTTFLALVLSSILVLLQQLVQEQEEYALNEVGQYCIDHLINKLYVSEK